MSSSSGKSTSDKKNNVLTEMISTKYRAACLCVVCVAGSVAGGGMIKLWGCWGIFGLLAGPCGAISVKPRLDAALAEEVSKTDEAKVGCGEEYLELAAGDTYGAHHETGDEGCPTCNCERVGGLAKDSPSVLAPVSQVTGGVGYGMVAAADGAQKVLSGVVGGAAGCAVCLCNYFVMPKAYQACGGAAKDAKALTK